MTTSASRYVVGCQEILNFDPNSDYEPLKVDKQRPQRLDLCFGISKRRELFDEWLPSGLFEILEH
jgi:hypothetical protein